jgi:hypothetical protein
MDFGSYYDFKAVIPSEEQFYTDVSSIYENVLERPVRPTEYRFEVTTMLPAEQPWWLDFIPYLITFGLFAFLWFFLMRQQSGGNKGMMNFGKSRARLTDPNGNNYRYESGWLYSPAYMREDIWYLSLNDMGLTASLNQNGYPAGVYKVAFYVDGDLADEFTFELK